MNILDKLMGPGLAAPETAGMKRLRWTVIALTTVLCVGVLLIDVLSAIAGPVATGAFFAVLLSATVCVGLIYFIRKQRRDDKWLDEQCAAHGDQP